MRRLLLLMPFLLMFTNSEAQLFNVFGHDVGFIYVGPKVGMSMSKLSNWDVAGLDNKFKYGYDFGIVGEFGFTNRFSINAEVNFVSKGIKQETDGFSSELKVNYIGIPLLAKLSFNALGLKKVYAMGGTYQNIRTGGEFKMKSGTFTQTESLIDSSWTRADWGLVFAVGAEYPTQYGIWALDIRYSQGFVDIHKSDDVKSRNQSIGFTLIYKYDLVDLLFKLKKNKSTKNTSDDAAEGTSKAKGLKVEE